MEILDSTLHMSTVDLPVKEEKETMNETDPVSSSIPVVQGDSEMNETKEEPLKEEKNDDEPTQDHQSESGHPSPHSEEESQKEEEVKEKSDPSERKGRPLKHHNHNLERYGHLPFPPYPYSPYPLSPFIDDVMPVFPPPPLYHTNIIF